MKSRDREFEFTMKDFKFLSALVFDETGIVLEEKKFEMVYGRLTRRLRKLQLRGFDDYIELLNGPNHAEEVSFLIDSITTNLTKFFREDHQFKALIKQVFEEKEKAAEKGGEKKIRIWSAGCSSGQEAYSLAMVAQSYFRSKANWDILILATDIDRNMLQKGREGIYSKNEISTIPANFRSKYTQKQRDGTYKMDVTLMDLIRFKHLNFMHEWPMKSKFDCIFCRNVLIYFDTETKEWLVNRFVEKLLPSGMLYLGHSEGMIGGREGIKIDGRSSFRKVSA